MEQLFLKVLNHSLVAGWMILAVVLLRILLKKAPKWVVCVLWGFVAIRLVFPFQIESIFSLVPSTDTVPDSIVYSAAPGIPGGIQAAGGHINPMSGNGLEADMAGSANPLQIWITVCSVIWGIGAAVMLVYTLASFWVLKKRVSASIQILGNVYVCDDVKSPFILGILCPKIYLPSKIDAATAEYVLVHEKTHLKRWDHVWKLFGFFILSVYWFHPLCWAAYILMCKDMEYACDEKATKDMDKIHRAGYCQALLTYSIKKRKIAACPVAFGETGVKGRIRAVLHYKKPAFWLVAASLAVCGMAAVCFMTNPEMKEQGKIAEQNKKPGGNKKTYENGKQIPATRQKIDLIVEHAASMSREGYKNVPLSYVDNAEAGWDDFQDNPWETDGQRDRIAQTALQELYTLTGCQLKECVYTTDGRSKFIFWKSANAIQKSTAFYSRDYGWTLAGDHTPEIGFVNARRAWYSDVQQLDSPYHNPEYQGHAAIPAWFLDHSGVYQGEKIKGYDAVGLEDPVFTHVKLMFDGGYYLVGMDDTNESVSNVAGPFYTEEQKDKSKHESTLNGSGLGQPEEFSKTKIQKEIKQVLDGFAEAYFGGDAKGIQKFLADSYDGDARVYEGDGTISGITLKGLPGMDGQDIGDGPYEVWLEYRDSNLEDTFQYINFSLARQDGSWKIQFYGVEL